VEVGHDGTAVNKQTQSSCPPSLTIMLNACITINVTDNRTMNARAKYSLPVFSLILFLRGLFPRQNIRSCAKVKYPNVTSNYLARSANLPEGLYIFIIVTSFPPGHSGTAISVFVCMSAYLLYACLSTYLKTGCSRHQILCAHCPCSVAFWPSCNMLCYVGPI